MKLKLDIKGMMCSACVSAVKNTVLKIKGVSFCDVSLITNNAFIEYDKDKITPDLIIKEIEKIGYGAEIHQNLNFKKEQEKRILENQKSKHKLISSIILLCALILIVISKMVFEKLNIYCFLTNIIINTSLQIAILLPIIVININYFISGFKSLLKLKPNMNSLVALGSTITTIYGITIFVISIATNNLEYLKNKIYFESSAMILTFVSIGKYIEHKATNKTNDVISKLVSMIPDFVTIKEKNNTKIISIDDLKINDKVIVKPGEIIPNDGIIIEGYGEINESTITGESIPEFKKINDEVTSGTLNENGFFIFKVTKLKEDNTLNKIIKLVEDASTSKIPIAKTVDKIAGIFVPFIIIISISVFLIWMLISQGNLDKSLNFAISTLVISCPCALGLATPLTIMIGAGKGAENGILIKSSEVIEKINKIDTIILDKTGTITKGEMKIQNFYGSQKYINEIISIEKLTNHPLGKAIVNYKKSKDIKIDKFEYLPGLGSVAFIKKNKFLIGNLKLIKKNKITINEEFNNKIEEFDKKGFTQVLVSRNNELINIICISDEIRNDSIESINSLKEFKKDNGVDLSKDAMTCFIKMGNIQIFGSL